MVLVTGGAGYVGSIVAEQLLKDGYEVIVLDNLKQGHRDAVPAAAKFVQADISVPQALEEVFHRLPENRPSHRDRFRSCRVGCSAQR